MFSFTSATPSARHAITETVRLLTRLSRKGAYLERYFSDAGAVYLLVAPGQPTMRRDRSRNDTGQIEVSLVSSAVIEGWLIRESDGARLRLSENGALALRRGTMTMRAPEVVSIPQSQRRYRPTRQSEAAGSTLDRLQRQRDGSGKPLISVTQAEAGNRLARDFLRGQMQPRVTADWQKAGQGERPKGASPGLGVELRDSVSDAQERVRRALDPVGPMLANLLIDICCLEVGLEETERRHGWPARTGRVVLQVALDMLARHYGMIAMPNMSASRTRSWGADGYRPRIDGGVSPASASGRAGPPDLG
jgi:hypothetical protein